MSNKRFSLDTTFSSIWSCYKNNYVKVVAVFLLTYLIPNIIFYNPMDMFYSSDVLTYSLVDNNYLMYAAAAFRVISMSYLTLGCYNLLLKLERGENAPFSDIFVQWRYLVKYLGIVLISGILGGVCTVFGMSSVSLVSFCFQKLFHVSEYSEQIFAYSSIFINSVLFTYLMTRILFAAPVLLDQNLGPIQSVKESFKLSKGQEWPLLVLFFVSTYKFIGGLLLTVAGIFISKIYTSMGLILTGVGILVVLPQVLLVWVSVYRQLKESYEQIESGT